MVVNDKLLVLLECDLIDLATTDEGHQASPRHSLRLDGDAVAAPGEESIRLCYIPVRGAIEREDTECCVGGVGGDDACERRRRGDFLVEEGDAAGGAGERGED